MADISVDVAVLGAGPGGYAAAFLAADLGLTVSLIDRAENPGGVCLYRGCIPSKALLHAAETITAAREAAAFGVDFGEPEIDRERLTAWKREVVTSLTGGLGQLAKQRKIEFIHGDGSFADPQTIAITNNETINSVQFGKAIIATGSSPALPPTLSNGSELIWDSTDALDLKCLPAKLLVVGGGYIGLEMATAYAALGSEVTVVEMTKGLLPGADRDLVRVLSKALKKRLHAIKLETAVEELVDDDKGVDATLRDNEKHYTTERFDAVLISTGRRPNTQGLGLENTAVHLTARGFIEVDEKRQTAEAAIYAIGDVTGQPMLAHKASREGRVAAEAIAGQNSAYDPAAIPAVVFTQPELAWVGLTETEAKQTGRQVAVGRFPWAASGRAKTLGNVDGLTKLITDPDNGQLLGCGIVGPGAGEMIAEATLAIEMGANAEDLALTIHAHPTLSETLMESAESLFGTATHIYRPTKKH